MGSTALCLDFEEAKEELGLQLDEEGQGTWTLSLELIWEGAALESDVTFWCLISFALCFSINLMPTPI